MAPIQPLGSADITASARRLSATSPETEFAALVDALAADSDDQPLLHLLREDHSVYEQRGSATVSRMRGWVLLALARLRLSDDALPFVLEELDTGTDPYLVAAAACALRSYPYPGAVFAPFVVRALDHVRYHDDPVSFEQYGEYDTSSSATSPVCELFETLSWLGPHAVGVLPQVEAVVRAGRLATPAMLAATRAIDAIRSAAGITAATDGSCCELPPRLAGAFSWSHRDRRGPDAVESVSFEDHDGTVLSFTDVFRGHPTIVVFFYTRCDNPLKCSLTVTKLARVQQLLVERGFQDRVHTAAITYDPAFDNAARICTYGRDRGVRTSDRHRMLRATAGMNALRGYFALGVNFIESLVNRHRVEAYVLDGDGRIAHSFERLLWDERTIVDRAVEVMAEPAVDSRPVVPTQKRSLPTWSASMVPGAVASVGLAFFPKCPLCWATYTSMLGVAGLVPFPAWLQPLLVLAMVVNLVSAWLRAWVTGRVIGPLLVSGGAAVILSPQFVAGWESVGPWGVGAIVAGSLMSAMSSRRAENRPGVGQKSQLIESHARAFGE